MICEEHKACELEDCSYCRAEEMLIDLARVEQVIADLDTQCTNGHAVKMLREAILSNRQCEWTESGGWDDQYWSSSCGVDWSFIEGDPTENNVKFCQGCGGKVVMILKDKEEWDDENST